MSAEKLRRALLVIAGALSVLGVALFGVNAMESERAATSVLQLFAPILGGAWGAALGARGEQIERGKVLVWAMMGAFISVVLVGLGVVVVWPLL